MGESPCVGRLGDHLQTEPLLPLAVSLEEELSRLSCEEREEFLKDLGLPARGLDRLLEVSCDLLNLITFYTTANDKLQAWLIPAGMKAPQAATWSRGSSERRSSNRRILRSYDRGLSCSSTAEFEARGRSM